MNNSNQSMEVIKKSHGRPSGSYNTKTVEAAKALGMSPADYMNFLKESKPKGQRGRPVGSKNVPKDLGIVQSAPLIQGSIEHVVDTTQPAW